MAKERVVVVVRGGNVESVLSDNPDGVQVAVVDMDNFEAGDTEGPFGVPAEKADCDLIGRLFAFGGGAWREDARNIAKDVVAYDLNLTSRVDIRGEIESGSLSDYSLDLDLNGTPAVFYVRFDDHADGNTKCVRVTHRDTGEVLYEATDLKDRRRSVAERIFDEYEFPNCVEAVNGWESSGDAEGGEWTRTVFLDMEDGNDTVKQTFVIVFEEGRTVPRSFGLAG